MTQKSHLIKKISNKVLQIFNLDKRSKVIKKTVNSKNANLKLFGNEYGGYELDIDLLKKNDKLTILSFGIGEDLSFSEDIMELLNAQIFAFDPTPRTAIYVSKHQLNNNKNFHFYQFGLSNSDKKQIFYLPKIKEYVSCSTHKTDNASEDYFEVEMRSFNTICNMLKLSSIDVLKMDIEGSEFDVVEEILNSNVSIQQICIELHDRNYDNGLERLSWILNILKQHTYSMIAISKSKEELTFVKT